MTQEAYNPFKIFEDRVSKTTPTLNKSEKSPRNKIEIGPGVDGIGGGVITVQKGDTLWSIANSPEVKAYFKKIKTEDNTIDTRMDWILKMNNSLSPLSMNSQGIIQPFYIKPGDKIWLPY